MQKIQKKTGVSVGRLAIYVAISILFVMCAGFVFLVKSSAPPGMETRNRILEIMIGLRHHQEDFGEYPSTEEGLDVLLERERPGTGETYIESKTALKDEWNVEFIYYSPGVHGEREYEILSYGRDRKKGGGELPDADIYSWENFEIFPVDSAPE